MSIYSGFSTRKQEEKYNKVVFGLILIFQAKINRDFTIS